MKYVKILIVTAMLLILHILQGSFNGNKVSANTLIYPQEKTMAVVVKLKELDLIQFKANNKITNLDSGGMFSQPIISPDKGYIAYLKDTALYVTTLKGEKTKVFDNVAMSSYVWFDKNHLLYSPEAGGIYSYDTEKKKSQPYVKNESKYQHITIGSYGKIYAEKYGYYNKDDKKYVWDYGVVLLTPDTREEKLIIHSIPSGLQNDLGMYPVIAGISKDFRLLYIFEHPHSASTAADGLRLASYDTKLNKYIQCPNKDIVTLRYSDNFSINPENSEVIALINGGLREMNENKTLGILNVITGTFEKLLPQGQVAMTPYYSADARNLLYAASEKIEGLGNIGLWFKNKHPIYKINNETKEITQLTNPSKAFDFAPTFISNEDIVFLRIEDLGNISMWKLEDGKETKIIDGLIFYNSKFEMQNYYGHFYNSDYICIS